MSKNKDKTKVCCDVTNCLHEEEGKCTLDDLNISCSCRGCDCNNTSSTLCQSFESSGGPITDTEYEVASEFDLDDSETIIME